MAPKKKKLPDKEAEKLILEEIQKQNRPFNHTLLHATLHNAVSKTQCTNLLDSLADKGKLIRKDFGKAKIYWPDQSNLETVPVEKLREFDKSIEDKKKQIKELQSQLSSLNSNLASIMVSQTTKDVITSIDKLKSENEILKEKEENLQEIAKSTDPKDLEKLEKGLVFTRSTWRTRKRLCMQILDGISEGMDKKVPELIEELGIETDEEIGVSLPARNAQPPRKIQKR